MVMSNMVVRARPCLAFVLARERRVGRIDGVKRARRLRSFAAMVASPVEG
jgi:hypothetical protein